MLWQQGHHQEWIVVTYMDGEEGMQIHGRREDLASTRKAKPISIWIEDSGTVRTQDPGIPLCHLNHSAPSPAPAQAGHPTPCPEMLTS